MIELFMSKPIWVYMITLFKNMDIEITRMNTQRSVSPKTQLTKAPSLTKEMARVPVVKSGKRIRDILQKERVTTHKQSPVMCNVTTYFKLKS